MRKRIAILYLFLMTVIGLSASAQSVTQSNPVRWRVNVKMISATEGEVIISATIDDGWHLYGMNIPKGGPKPTVIDFKDSKGVKFLGNISQSVPPTSYHDTMFDLNLSCWEKKVTFRRRFKVTDRSNALIAGTISFMSCNNVNCSSPTTENFSKKVPIK